MNNKVLSHILKGFLILLGISSLFFMIDILPIMAEQGAQSTPEMEHLKIPLLIASELVVALFIAGLGIIFYLLILFDQGKVFTPPFTKSLNILSILCYVAVIGFNIVIYSTVPYGGPGPMGFFGMILTIAIIVLGIALNLFARVINQAIDYKLENDLTV